MAFRETHRAICGAYRVAFVLLNLTLLASMACTPSGGGTGPQGPEGPQGPPGVDGSIRIYGDGSQGAQVFAVSNTLSGGNYQFTDFTVNAGVTIGVSSGSVIRCTGTFTNNGIIQVEVGAFGSTRDSADFLNASDLAFTPTEAGLSLTAAGFGEFGSNAFKRKGGRGGSRLSSDQAANILSPGVKAGGTGAGTLGMLGGEGGGSLVVLAKTAVVNAAGGIIAANGGGTAPGSTSGVGGGAGGFVILASPGSVTNEGNVQCTGGRGADSGMANGAGGGGGGGVIHIISPTIAGAGTKNVIGGSPGTASGALTFTPREGGAGGGALGGNGGDGGAVEANNTPDAAEAGENGILLNTTADPTSLF